MSATEKRLANLEAFAGLVADWAGNSGLHTAARTLLLARIQGASTEEHPLMARAYEVVHHSEGCPSIGGGGDKDCRCDAVPFLNDLRALLSARQETRHGE